MQAKKLEIMRLLQVNIIMVLSLFIIVTIWNVDRMQGTARIINYAGIVRGETQRLVKMEMAHRPNQPLEDQLGIILLELKQGGNLNNLSTLDDEQYQKCLDRQIAYWENVKAQIALVREGDYEETNIIPYSEYYNVLANETVATAEKYAERMTKMLYVCEWGTTIFLIFLLVISLYCYSLSSRLTKEKEKRILHQAEYDSLTEVLNRRSFDRLLSLYEVGETPFALHLVDVDLFKKFNDNYGHAMGDEVLRRVARELKNCCRNVDHVCRIGGDEFAILMVGMPREFQYAIEAKLLSVKEILLQPDGACPPITLSIGVAFSDSIEAGHKIFECADEALYKVKEAGRNGFGFYGIDSITEMERV